MPLKFNLSHKQNYFLSIMFYILFLISSLPIVITVKTLFNILINNLKFINI